jgi:hypothetical protein
MMTKQQERDLVQTTIDNLPDSYLRDMLSDARDAIYRDIDSDVTLTLSEYARGIEQAREEQASRWSVIKGLREEVRQEQATVSGLARQRDELRAEVIGTAKAALRAVGA